MEVRGGYELMNKLFVVVVLLVVGIGAYTVLRDPPDPQVEYMCRKLKSVPQSGLSINEIMYIKEKC
jgi:hypothetical protein